MSPERKRTERRRAPAPLPETCSGGDCAWAPRQSGWASCRERLRLIRPRPVGILPANQDLFAGTPSVGLIQRRRESQSSFYYPCVQGRNRAKRPPGNQRDYGGAGMTSQNESVVALSQASNLRAVGPGTAGIAGMVFH